MGAEGCMPPEQAVRGTTKTIKRLLYWCTQRNIDSDKSVSIIQPPFHPNVSSGLNLLLPFLCLLGPNQTGNVHLIKSLVYSYHYYNPKIFVQITATNYSSKV